MLWFSVRVRAGPPVLSSRSRSCRSQTPQAVRLPIPFRLTVAEQRKLPARRPPERGGGKGRSPAGEARLAAGDPEQGVDLFGQDSFAAHPRAETRVVQPAAPQGAEALEHFVLFFRVVVFEPPREQRRDRVRQ